MRRWPVIVALVLAAAVMLTPLVLAVTLIVAHGI